MSEYEHSGTWTCDECGTEKEIENKLGVLGFAMTHDCADSSTASDDLDDGGVQ